ncbi:hypothetical protein CGH72_24545 [Vibrio parahaemolyticus]|nr:hypothetical protein [Vibrio parahaemolyticus]TOM53927.1 hypothetical protein CGH75_22725 [Vibrio parahaemolyticus]TOM65170.1 hypothetical protein CGH72_24545 [Vibrio parahaemolyticus]TOM68593.1 hypothetical protein CGH73_10605 [Vibrio parahaemolyticus]TOO78021.1 hypothetical protein CGH29_25515 [Vibrio parahaemolyticus]
MLNQIKSVVYSFSLFPQLLVLYSSASWLQWALFSGHLFFGVGSSENCLNQNFELRFLSFSSQNIKSDFQKS